MLPTRHCETMYLITRLDNIIAQRGRQILSVMASADLASVSRGGALTYDLLCSILAAAELRAALPVVHHPSEAGCAGLTMDDCESSRPPT